MLTQTYDEGILRGFKVTQRAAGANFSVDLAAGAAIIQGDDQANQGAYLVEGTTTENLTVTAAPGSNSRLDRLVLEVRDPTAAGAAGNDWQPRVIAGVAAATPSLPALPPTAIHIAQIGPIVPGTASITNSLATDGRVQAGPRGLVGSVLTVAHARTISGHLLADGSNVSRTTYADLFDIMGTTYGAGDGTTTFGLPDWRGRGLNGALDMGGSTPTGNTRIAGSTLGAVVGEAAHALTLGEGPAHGHAIDHDHAAFQSATESSTHTHTLSLTTDPANVAARHSVVSSASAGTVFPDILDDNMSTGPAESGHTHGVAGNTLVENSTHYHGVDVPAFTGTSGSTGSGTGHNTVHPTMAVYVWIRV